MSGCEPSSYRRQSLPHWDPSSNLLSNAEESRRAGCLAVQRVDQNPEQSMRPWRWLKQTEQFAPVGCDLRCQFRRELFEQIKSSSRASPSTLILGSGRHSGRNCAGRGSSYAPETVVLRKSCGSSGVHNAACNFPLHHEITVSILRGFRNFCHRHFLHGSASALHQNRHP